MSRPDVRAENGEMRITGDSLHRIHRLAMRNIARARNGGLPAAAAAGAGRRGGARVPPIGRNVRGRT